MKVLFTPRDSNPYQGDLARALGALGVEVGYLPFRTRSQTLNLSLLPVEALIARASGYRILHIHWVYRFAIPGRERFPLLRRVARAWLGLFLMAARVSGLRVVWTAHNVLPHTPVFDDDVAGRRRLAQACDAVISHSDATLTELAQIVQLPDLTATIPQGPVREASLGSGHRREVLGIPADARCLGMVGRLERYKGVTDLVQALATVPGDGIRLLLAGECTEPTLRTWLADRAAQDSRIVLDLRRLSDEEFGCSLRTLDVSVMPFRSIANSSSALAALGAGLPLLLPDGVLADLPVESTHRYATLESGLIWARDVDRAALRQMAVAAVRASEAWTWDDAARATSKVYDDVLLEGSGGQLATRLPISKLPDGVLR